MPPFKTFTLLPDWALSAWAESRTRIQKSRELLDETEPMVRRLRDDPRPNPADGSASPARRTGREH
jgi:hypothetical protein